MTNNKKRKHPIYYSNVWDDDFGGKKRPTKDRYDGSIHIKRTGLYAFLSNVFFYSIVVPLVWIWNVLIGCMRFKGKKNLKQFKKKNESCFIYSNHAGVKDVTGNYLLMLPKRLNTIGYSDATSSFILKWLVPLLGFVPLPTDIHDMNKFMDALKFYLEEKKQSIVIFPEAHIWKSYTGVRDFKRVSFRYPAMMNKAVVPIFYARRKRKGLWKLFKNPRITCIVGEPIYPDPNLSVKENTQILGDKCYESMLKMSKSIEQEEFWHYVYRPIDNKGDAKEIGENK